MGTKALIVVDAQRAFCEGGSLPVDGGRGVCQRIAEYLEIAGSEYVAVAASLDWHKPFSASDNTGHFSATPDFVDSWPVHCVENTAGAKLDDEVYASVVKHKNSRLFFKGRGVPAYSAFEARDDAGQDLRAWLDQFKVSEVDVAGLATDYCVKATVLDSIKVGYKTDVLWDLTAAVGGELAVAEVRAQIFEAG